MTPVCVCVCVSVCVCVVRESVCVHAYMYHDMAGNAKRRAEVLQEDSFLTSRGVSMARDIGVTYEWVNVGVCTEIYRIDQIKQKFAAIIFRNPYSHP